MLRNWHKLIQNHLGRFRLTAWLEGWSYLLLLFIAMPLKYMLNMPIAVKIIGAAHGGLFILYVALLLVVAQRLKWSIIKILLAFLASLVPFGTFIADAKIFQHENHN